MAEIGVVRFAQVAREIAEGALPRSRSACSKHTFTQSSLLAILCLMRYEDWTSREAEVRLGEHAERREVLGLERVPDYTTLYRCLRRTSEDDVGRLLHETIRRMPPPPEEGTTVAVDGTGLAPGAISTFFVNRIREPDPRTGSANRIREPDPRPRRGVHLAALAAVGGRGRPAPAPDPGA